MKTFACSDAGIGCRGEVTGESEEEVLEKAVAHAKQAHGVDLARSKTLMRYARTFVREETE